MIKTIQQILYVAIPAISIFLCFRPYRNYILQAMKLESTFLHEVFLLFYIALLSGILALKLWPSYIIEPTSGLWGDIILLTNRPTWNYMVNLKPFSMFSDYYRYYCEFGSANLLGIISNILGNITLFIPVSFLTSLLFRKPTWQRSVLVGTGIAIFTEVGQYFIVRNVSIDDVLLNTVGVIFGHLLHLLVRKKRPDITNLFYVRKINN